MRVYAKPGQLKWRVWQSETTVCKFFGFFFFRFLKEVVALVVWLGTPGFLFMYLLFCQRRILMCVFQEDDFALVCFMEDISFSDRSNWDYPWMPKPTDKVNWFRLWCVAFGFTLRPSSVYSQTCSVGAVRLFSSQDLVAFLLSLQMLEHQGTFRVHGLGLTTEMTKTIMQLQILWWMTLTITWKNSNGQTCQSTLPGFIMAVI